MKTERGKTLKFTDVTLLFTILYQGPKSILLQRSADIHGFSEELEDSQGQGASGRSSEKKVVQRLVDMLGKTRKRRSSEDEEQKLSALPRKQPVAHVDLDF